MILYPGSATVVEREFPAEIDVVTVAALDFNGLTIPTSGAVFLNGLWRTTISIPTTAPACTPTSGYYKLVWTHDGGTVEQDFQVIAYDEGVQRPAPAGFGINTMLGGGLTDELYLPMGTTNVTCEILQYDGATIASSGTLTHDSVATPSLDSPGSMRFTAEFTNVAGMGVGEYVLRWRYEIGGRAQYDYRQGFVISTKMAGAISSFRMFLDQSQLTRWLGHYQFHEVELVDCLYRGVDRINAAPPQSTTFTPDNIHTGLVHALRYAALHEMLNRLYLAEGLSSFDFQGGSIQVNVERTQYIQTKMDELNSWLESNLVPVKTVAVASRSIGVLHLSVSTGGLNNNYRANGRLFNPSNFQLSRISGYGLL